MFEKSQTYSGSEFFELAVNHKLHQVIFEGKQLDRISDCLVLVHVLHGFPVLPLLLIKLLCNSLCQRFLLKVR
jgi:hypothetical protein